MSKQENVYQTCPLFPLAHLHYLECQKVGFLWQNRWAACFDSKTVSNCILTLDCFCFFPYQRFRNFFLKSLKLQDFWVEFCGLDFFSPCLLNRENEWFTMDCVGILKKSGGDKCSLRREIFWGYLSLSSDTSNLDLMCLLIFINHILSCRPLCPFHHGSWQGLLCPYHK